MPTDQGRYVRRAKAAERGRVKSAGRRQARHRRRRLQEAPDGGRLVVVTRPAIAIGAEPPSAGSPVLGRPTGSSPPAPSARARLAPRGRPQGHRSSSGTARRWAVYQGDLDPRGPVARVGHMRPEAPAAAPRRVAGHAHHVTRRQPIPVALADETLQRLRRRLSPRLRRPPLGQSDALRVSRTGRRSRRHGCGAYVGAVTCRQEFRDCPQPLTGREFFCLSRCAPRSTQTRRSR